MRRRERGHRTLRAKTNTLRIAGNYQHAAVEVKGNILIGRISVNYLGKIGPKIATNDYA